MPKKIKCEFCHMMITEWVTWYSVIDKEQHYFCESRCCQLWLKEHKPR